MAIVKPGCGGVSGRAVPGEPGAAAVGGRRWGCCISQVLKVQLANLETNRKCNPGVHTFLLKFSFLSPDTSNFNIAVGKESVSRILKIIV